uniref:Uncharacterized protein n=1 Tax=Utricularia reniformis TaxID=192314 RepID=A0A1Y0B3J3_9LAMI|nr:hypothetical protein AEK19_MT1780 [Utricularia reniformis]ART31953.1 hypothetical protein AEK19_MT1780 [Utricularia reniformis]
MESESSLSRQSCECEPALLSRLKENRSILLYCKCRYGFRAKGHTDFLLFSRVLLPLSQ